MKKKNVLILSAILAASMCGCQANDSKDRTIVDTTAQETAAQETTIQETTTHELTTQETTVVSKPYSFKYNRHYILPQYDSALSDEERSSVLSLIDAISQGAASSPVNGLGEDAAYKVWYAARLSDPLSAQVDENSVEYSNDQLVFTYKYDSKEVKKRVDDWYALINKIITENISEGDSEKEIAKKIFDYMAQNVHYNYDVLDDANAIDQLSAYVALTEGTGVCYNYSLAYAFLVGQCGLTCYEVDADSTVVGSGGHAWNMVQIDGKFYQLDSTWASSDLAHKDTYFGMTDTQRKDGLKENNDLNPDFYIRTGQSRDDLMEMPKCDESLQ